MAMKLEERVRFDAIRYANCWEDADILCTALEPGPGKRFLSVASAGDNSLALLAEGAEVIAADLSPAQLACVELRTAAFRRLEYDELLAFVGVRPSSARLSTYKLIERDLSEDARAFWNANSENIEKGIVLAGKFENYFRLFRQRVMPLVHSRRRIEQLLEEKDLAARREFYEKRWNNLRWRLLFRVFFSRFFMGRLGRDPEFFRYVEGSVADRILSRTRYAMTELPTHTNPYLQFILLGNFTRTLPRYLERERFVAIRNGLDRLTLFRGNVQEAAHAHRQDGFDGFNLSDIFEYVDPATCCEVYASLLETAKPGARIAYWNMLAPRRCPDKLTDRVRPLDDLAREAFNRDRAFFYSAFIVEAVR